MQFSLGRTGLLGTLLTVASVCASAQTSDPAKPATPPAAVGVTPQTAATANQKAVPRADTATVVRTGPTVAERAKSTASGVMASMPSASGTGTGTDSGMRPAKSDRN